MGYAEVLVEHGRAADTDIAVLQREVEVLKDAVSTCNEEIEQLKKEKQALYEANMGLIRSIG